MSLDTWRLDAKPAPSLRGSLRRLQDRLLPSEAANTTWHVSPAIDLFGYGFAWLVAAAPIYLMLGAERLVPRDYRTEGLVFLAMGVLLFDVHRHFTFPYVFLDPSVRRRFPLRVFLLPALLFGLLTQLPALWYSDVQLSVPGVAAVAAWLLLLFQTLRHDGMGSRSRMRALWHAVAALALGTAVGVVAPGSGSLAWWMLLIPTAASLALSARLFRSLAEGEAAVADVRPARRRSGLLPGTLIALVAVSAAARVLAPGLLVPVSLLVNGIFVAYIGWLLHHGMSQKYGILRIYSSKSGHETKVPGWVDRFVAWSWIPMLLVWTAGASPEMLRAYLDNQSLGASNVISPLMRLTERHFVAALLVASLPIVGGLATFGYYEWKLHRLQNVPRLGYVAGTSLLYASIFVIGPAGAYVAFAASHSIEYMTFILAFQRRRYGRSDGSAPVLEHVTRHPLVYFGTGVAGLLALFVVGRYVLGYGVAQVPYAFGYPIPLWVYWYSILQAMIHFYYDGFLWKLRRPELARSI